MTEQLQIEATGETVGEAKWSALRELERLQPGLDKAAVKFQVVSEGERGLLGVGFAPARVIATVAARGDLNGTAEEVDESELAATVRELLGRIVREIGVHARLTIEEDDETLTAAFSGRDLGLLIGKQSWSTRPATANDARQRSTRSRCGAPSARSRRVSGSSWSR